MSLFRTIQTDCPSCGVSASFDLVHSVNADRRPALRAELLAGTFQRLTCGACGDVFRLEPEFTYVDAGRKQWISVWPASRLGEWQQLEKKAVRTFQSFYGPGADPVAAAIGRDLVVRVVFGWEAIHEKLVAGELGVDDHLLELAKIALMRAGEATPDSELRLYGREEGQFLLGLFEDGSLIETLTVPPELLSEIAAAPEAWAALRSALTAGPFVDVARLTVP